MEEKRKLSGKEKFAYGIGAVGKDMVYMLSASYILYYYQDIMGVSAWIMGVILMIARVFDAFNDPLMGVLVAKTKSRWGKFRPWLFIGTLTNAVVMFAMFACPPQLNGGGLAAYAAASYILWGITYTMMDIPYWSMVPAFTEGGKEREGLSAMARTCAGVGSALISVITVIAVSFLGNTFNAKSTTNVTNEFKKVTAYVVEMDETGAATGHVKEIKDGVTVSVKADKSEFENSFSFNEVNATYTATIDGKVFKKDANEKENVLSSTMDFAMDDVNGEAAFALYVSEDNYAALQDASTVSVTIESKKQVERLGFKYFALAISIIFFVFILITCICIKEKSTVDVQTVKVKDMFKSLLQNDQAMAMVVTIVLVNTATYITSNLVIYFFKYDLGGSNWEGNYTLFTTFGGAMQILAMMAFFPLLRKLFSSMKTFYVAVFSAIFGYVVLLLLAIVLKTQSVFPFLVPAFFIMSAMGILNVLVTVFLANTVDYGELKNNRRDESVIFSMQTFVVKLASGIAALVASLCLQVFDISSSSGEIEAVDGSLLAGLTKAIKTIQENGATAVSGNSVLGLRLVMTVVPIFVLVVALLVFRKRYILSDAKVAEISAEIKAKKAIAEQ